MVVQWRFLLPAINICICASNLFMGLMEVPLWDRLDIIYHYIIIKFLYHKASVASNPLIGITTVLCQKRATI